jgi:hypothetical protein
MENEIISTLETIGLFFVHGAIDEETAVRLIDQRVRQYNLELEICFYKETAEKYRSTWLKK